LTRSSVAQPVIQPWVSVGKRVGQLRGQAIDVRARRHGEPGIGDALPVGHG
jgi:hypothetical protein